jgi:hypothetical protein
MKKTQTTMAIHNCHSTSQTRKQSFWLRFASAIVLAGATFAASKAGATNILLNSDFELGFNAWTKDSPATWNQHVESQDPNHSGSMIYKVYGSWSTPTSYQNLYQDNPAGPGDAYSPTGWLFSRSTDYIGTGNFAYLQVSFFNGTGTELARYASESFTNGTTADTWTSYAVDGQVDMSSNARTNSGLGSITAPAGTAKVRFSIVFKQTDWQGGAVHIDDVDLNQTAGNQPPNIVNLAPNDSSMFNPASGGLSFNATSLTTNISASGIQLLLNTLDVSGSLSVGGTPSNRSVTYSALNSNRVYSAVITVTDDAGYVRSASIAFDTFSTNNFVWEAEDYDYSGGLYINNPIVSSTATAGSYFGLIGVDTVDFVDPVWGGNSGQAYRAGDVPGPGTEWSYDFMRQKYLDAIAAGDTNLHEHLLGWTYNGVNGDWANYTRDFPSNTYNIYGRLSGGGGTSDVKVRKVTAGWGTSSQTVVEVGDFKFTSRGWQTYDWVPATDASGNLVSITLNGTNTFKISGDNANHNFFMLAPARDDLPLIANLYPNGSQPFQPTNGLTFNAISLVSTIPTGNITVTLNGYNMTPLLSIGGVSTNRSVSLAGLASNAIYTATISVTDAAGTPIVRTINFDTFSEGNMMFEAEDYDFGTNQWIASPVLSTTPGVNNYYYQSIPAENGIDISGYTNVGQKYIYRPFDAAGTEVASDYLRQTYVTAQGSDPLVTDYDVGWWDAGAWFNYTRSFAAGNYNVYARAASPSTATLTLDKVTAGVGTTNQTTVTLGTMPIVGAAWQDWQWSQLVSGGSAAVVNLSGVTTLKVTSGGNANGNYYMLAPAKNSVSLSASMPGASPVISFPSQAGASYMLVYSSSLNPASWQFLTMIGGDGTTKSYTDTSATGSTRYYRAIVQ